MLIVHGESPGFCYRLPYWLRLVYQAANESEETPTHYINRIGFLVFHLNSSTYVTFPLFVSPKFP